jgi:hypothetical protein
VTLPHESCHHQQAHGRPLIADTGDPGQDEDVDARAWSLSLYQAVRRVSPPPG